MDQETQNPTVWLHVHVPKAGGSTIRQLLNRTFCEGYYNSNSLLETKQYTRDEVSEIVRCHPWLRGFSDHKLSLNLPWHHPTSKIRALAFVRDPVERFISRYFFHRNFEEVNCIAQRMSFHEFSEAELVNKYVHPQTNSQIFFLNNGMGDSDMSVIDYAIGTGLAHLYPIERFDDACVCLEALFPETFSDLSYKRANVSKKDLKISDEDREFAMQHLKTDYPVFELANQEIDKSIQSAFKSDAEFQKASDDFKTRCENRFDNFNINPPKNHGNATSKLLGSASNRNRIGKSTGEGASQTETAN